MIPKPLAAPALVAALLVAATVASYVYLDAERTRAGQAREDLAACRDAADGIARLQYGPDLAADGERLASEVTGLVERATKAAQLPQHSLKGIMPAPAQRVGDTPYKEKPTQVVVEKANLRSIVALMHGLASSQPPLEIRSLTLTAARAEDDADAWDAGLSVTYLIYDPPPAGK